MGPVPGPEERSMSEPSGSDDTSDEPLEVVGANPDARFYFVSYWMWEDGWMPREALIALHPLEWLTIEKRETRNHVHLSAWQELDRATYLEYHAKLNLVDEEFSEPTALHARPPLPP
jgi:hypothetical protein